MMDSLRRKWDVLLAVWNVTPSSAEQTFEEVCAHYAEPGRFYHTLDHIGSVLETVEGIGSFARNLNAVKLAAWLHDVIYDSKAANNEEQSAAFAERLCEKFRIAEGQWIASLILKTKIHADGDDDPDGQVLIDADLAILGSSEAAYAIYAEQIRQEYAWVPERDYREGRRQVLERFLGRPRIFCFLHRLEEPARLNIAAEIARLAR
jgi:predicted metal-dependent HD superfamily phosphohydrolase